MIDEDDPRPCLICGSAVLDVAGDPDADGAVFETTLMPITDNVDDRITFRVLEISVCAHCLAAAAAAGRVVLQTTTSLTPDLSLWTG